MGEEGLLTLCGDDLRDRGWQIAAIVTAAESVASWARKNHLPVFANLERMVESLNQRAQFLFSVTNFSIVSDSVIAWPEIDAFNFHDGPLPEVGGLNTPSWAIIRGSTTHGISWHKMTSDVDGGEVYVRKDIEISPRDSALELNAKCFEAGYAAFQELIDKIESDTLEGSRPRVPDSFFKRAHKPQYLGFISWHDSVTDIERLYRATEYGGYRNGFASTRILTSSGCLCPESVKIVDDSEADAKPGTVLGTSSDGITVKALDGTIELGLAADSNNANAISVGDVLPDIRGQFPEEFPIESGMRLYDDMRWASLLRKGALHTLQHVGVFRSDSSATLRPVGETMFESKELALATVALVIARTNDNDVAGLALSNLRLRSVSERLNGGLSPYCPSYIDTEVDSNRLLESCASALTDALHCPPVPSDFFVRMPALRHLESNVLSPRCSFSLLASSDALEPSFALEADFSFVYCESDRSLHLISRCNDEQHAAVESLLLTAKTLIEKQCNLSTTSLLADSAKEKIDAVNTTAIADYVATTVDQLVTEQVAKTPDACALYSQGESCTFKELDDRATVVASYLLSKELPNSPLVGVMIADKIQSVCTMLGILRAGAAYVPLDPSYPTSRLRHIIRDAGLNFIFADSASARAHEMQDTCIDSSMLSASVASPLRSESKPQDRAYVIYTSGSTGNPKGVQVTHDNVANFLLGMDAVIGLGDGVMLSVTSISFDIAVLEIWWSLTRGLKVVFYDAENTVGDDVSAEDVPRRLSYSLYFWNSQDPDAPSTVSETYDLLRQAVVFGDENGFEAIWSPERHFGSFGGPFPNPAVTNAALATITKNIQLRAGSCVMPLHHPIRVAEDWAMIDNLSDGRVGISFASGWMPRDFVLAPENHASAKDVMFDGIKKVRALWRGNSVSFTGPLGEDQISTLPRPVQDELPSWLTTAGSPETFAQAGDLGLNILTHLLGQSADDLAEKIQVYQTAWRQAGHEGAGRVTLMLHTFVTESKEYAREISRGPMKAYLRSAMSLVKAAAWEFPTFKKMSSSEKSDMDEFFANLSEEDHDDLLEFAFHRYFEESGLFGAPEDNLKFVEKLGSIGVTEIACLIDFGIPNELVLRNLEHLNELRVRSSGHASNSLSAIVDRFGISHMQCTPSQAKMFALDQDDLRGLSKLDVLLVGGEAVGQKIADDLCQTVSGKIVNMYGPTETTVWSLTQELRTGEPVKIGYPIANTTVSVVDRSGRQVPFGWTGELCIGGKGVTQGYLGKPELTAEKFKADDDDRRYSTGDVVRMLDDGSIEFIGRNDDQIKIRGYRIESGEVEYAIEKLSAVDEAVVVGETDKWGDAQLVAYFRGGDGATGGLIRSSIAKSLPNFMIPSRFVRLETIPRTLNGKVDRRALRTAPPFVAKIVATESKRSEVSPPTAQSAIGSTKVQKDLLDIWRDLLENDDIDIHANFFDLGGHSILAVRMQGILSRKYGKRMPISQLFRYPTVATLASHIESSAKGDGSSSQKIVSGAAARAARRKSRHH